MPPRFFIPIFSSLVFLLPGAVNSAQAAAVFTYSAAADGNWSTTTNWTPNGTPNAVGDFVQKTQSTSRTVTQDIAAGVTVGTLTTSNGSFVVQTNNQITLNNGGAGATISNTGSNGTTGLMTVGINSGAPTAGITLADNLNITNTFATSTNVSGSIKLNAIIGGNGNLTISNVLNNPTQGQIRFEAVNTFAGTVGISKGAVTYNVGSAFGSLASNTITLGSFGQGSVSLVSSAALGNSFTSSGALNNNLVAAASTGGTTLIGSLSTAATGLTNYAGTLALNGDLSVTSAQTTLGVGVFLSGVISGTGKLTIAGTGFTNILGSGTNTFTGDTLVSSGTLAIGGGAGPTSTASVSNALAGSTLDTSGAGAVVFGTSTASMITSVALGGLKGSGNLSLLNTNTTPAAVTLNVGGNGTDTNYSGLLSGTLASVTKIGTGRLTLSNANAYTGTTTISAGTLIAGIDAPASVNGAFGNTANSIKLGDANTATNNSSVTLLTGGTFNIGRAITVQNRVTTGVYTIGGDTDNPSTFSGGIQVNQNLRISQVTTSGGNALSISGGITSAGGSQTITFAGPGAINVGTTAIGNGSGTLAVNVIGGANTFSSANTYSGATTISGGTLSLDNNNAPSPRLLNTSGIAANGGGTLLLAQSGATASSDRISNTVGITLAGGTMNLSGKSEIATGSLSASTNGVGTLTLSANSTLDFGIGNSGNLLQFSGVSHTSGTGGVLAIINWEGTPDIGGGSEQLLFSGLASSFTSQFAQSDVSFNGGPGYSAIQFGSPAGDATSYFEIVAAVPEPTTVLGALALVGLVGYRERKYGRRLLRAFRTVAA